MYDHQLERASQRQPSRVDGLNAVARLSKPALSRIDASRYSKRKRVKGIEPSPKAWEAFVLPLNYTRVVDGVN